MNKTRYLSNALLWATAIVASAAVDAPQFFTMIMLPSLAACALLLTLPKKSAAVVCTK